jgi:hypothetical protein
MIEDAAQALYHQDCEVSEILEEEKVPWSGLKEKEKQIYRDDALICFAIFEKGEAQ